MIYNRASDFFFFVVCALKIVLGTPVLHSGGSSTVVKSLRAGSFRRAIPSLSWHILLHLGLMVLCCTSLLVMSLLRSPSSSSLYLSYTITLVVSVLSRSSSRLASLRTILPGVDCRLPVIILAAHSWALSWLGRGEPRRPRRRGIVHQAPLGRSIDDSHGLLGPSPGGPPQ